MNFLASNTLTGQKKMPLFLIICLKHLRTAKSSRLRACHESLIKDPDSNETPDYLIQFLKLILMQVAFAKRALKDPDLRIAHNVHKMSSLLSGMLFIADDMFPRTQYIHAAWHLAAAVGVGTCNKLLE